jgi:mRNA-degrading endonuclease toxin of MazEF toxin-antitoxin module
VKRGEIWSVAARGAYTGKPRPPSSSDKLTTVPRTSLGERIGRLGDEDIARLDRASVVFLGVT